MTNEEKRFKIERVEKINDKIKKEKLLTAIIMGFEGLVIFGTTYGGLTTTEAFFLGASIGTGGISIMQLFYCIKWDLESKKITSKELEEQGIDVKEELKKRKRTKQNN